MKLVYCDEAGDTGKLPKSESEIFVMTFLYLKTSDWKDIFNLLLQLRRELKNEFNLPIRLELHARNFILNKSPYTRLNLTNQSRIKIIEKLLQLITKLSQDKKIACINTVIAKKRIEKTQPPYPILEQALSLGLTRIDTNIYKNKEDYSHFMLVIDEGNTNATRKISRKLYRHNYVPYQESESGRQIKLESLIDDPLPKDSKDSYLIQLADFIAYIVSQYIYIQMKIDHSPKRKRIIADDVILEWMEKMKDVFNLNACPKGEFGYGIVVHPKNKKDGF